MYGGCEFDMIKLKRTRGYGMNWRVFGPTVVRFSVDLPNAQRLPPAVQDLMSPKAGWELRSDPGRIVRLWDASPALQLAVACWPNGVVKAVAQCNHKRQPCHQTGQWPRYQPRSWLVWLATVGQPANHFNRTIPTPRTPN